MTTNDTFDRRLTSWLHDEAEHRMPDHLDEVLARTAATRQRAWWSSLERWLPVDMTRRFSAPLTMPAARIVLVGLLILALLAAVAIVGSRRPSLPEPFGIARNGVFVTSRDGDIYRIDPASTEATAIVSGEGFDFGPIFSRDGTRFAFLRSDGPLSGTGPAVLALYVADADGSAVRAITPPSESLDWFDWSPDGSRIAYVADGSLLVADLTGAEPRRLSGADRVHYPTWRPPDGAEILARRETGVPAILAFAPDGAGEPRQVSTTPANNRFDYQSIALSTDGKHLTFTRWFDRGPDGRPYPESLGWLPRVYALDIASGAEVVLPTAPGTGQRGSAVYSPDGKLVAYARIYREGAFQIVVADADGSGNERTFGPKLPGPPDGSSIAASWAFTPDGAALLVRYGDDTAAGTRLLPLDGSAGGDLGPGAAFEFVDVQRLAP